MRSQTNAYNKNRIKNKFSAAKEEESQDEKSEILTASSENIAT